MVSQDDWYGLLDDEKIPAPRRAPEPKDMEPLADWNPSIRGYSIARAALKTINGDRQDQYGNPENSFGAIAGLWHAYLKALKPDMPALTPEDIANMMILLKMARMKGGEYKRDNDVDLLGYAMLGADMREKANEHD